MESTEVLQALPMGKLQVVDRVPKVIEKLEFGILSIFPAPRGAANPLTGMQVESRHCQSIPGRNI